MPSGILSLDYEPSSGIYANSTCSRSCEACTKMFSLIPSSIQLAACILTLAFYRYQNRKSNDDRSRVEGLGMPTLMLPAHYGFLLLFSGLSFVNFAVSCAFATTEYLTSNTYTFLLYTPSALDFGQNCGVVAYLLYPGAGKAAISRFWTSFFVAFAYYITCYSVVMEFGNYRDLLILPMVVNVLLMLVTFFLGVVPNSVVFRRTGCRRVCLLVGLCATADLATDVLHYSKCPSCAYCPFILKTLFFSGMVMPLLVYWSLLLDSLYWLGMTNDIAGTSDMSGYDNVAIDQPLVGISLNHQAASELAQSLGSQSMKRVALIPHNRIKLKVHMSKLQLLGTGGTAKVYKGMYNDKFGPKPCAVKVSFFVEFNPEVIREVIREAGLCGTIKHSRIVEFYGISVMPPSIALVFELCEHGSLEKFLRRGRGRLSEKNKLLLCLDCALAVECLHSIQSSDGLHFSHGDLKSPNFLVTREGVVKLSDLATCSPSSSSRLANLDQPIAIPRRSDPAAPNANDFTQKRRTTGINKLVGDSAKPGLFQRQSSFIGALKKNFGAAGDEGAAPSLRFAPQWTAPEMLRTPMGTSSVASDIYSLGVVFWEIFHEEEPFGDQPNLNSDPSELIKKLEEQQISLKFDPTRCEATMVKLYESMTAFEPHMRPSASQVAQAVLKLIDHETPEIYRTDIDPNQVVDASETQSRRTSREGRPSLFGSSSFRQKNTKPHGSAQDAI